MNCHIIHKAATGHHSAHDALAMIGGDDEVVFIDDGIYNAFNKAYLEALLQKTDKLFVIDEHMFARGFTGIPDALAILSMQQFVQLSLDATHNISWY